MKPITTYAISWTTIFTSGKQICIISSATGWNKAIPFTKKHLILVLAFCCASLFCLPFSVTSLAAQDFTQLGIDIDGEAAGDRSGSSVALSSDGTRIAIGAYDNGGTGSYAGHVRIYDWNGTNWTQVGNDIDGEAGGDNSGNSVALSSDGTRIAIGAPYNDGTASNAGHVRIYDWNGTSWTQVGNDIDGEAADDNSGWSVALSSDGIRLAIGARNNDGTASNAGHVRIYDWNGTSWMQVGNDIDGEAADDQSGWSVALSSDGSRIAIGANQNDGTAGNAGHVRVYDWNGSAWTQVGNDIDGEAASDGSGFSVALSSDGTRIAIGANLNDGTASNAGHVLVYDWNGSAWTQVGNDIDGEAADDQSRSVALSSDGTRLAIGAPFNDGTAGNAGHVRVYDWNGSAWTQVGNDIDGEAANDQSGYSVAISSDGSRIAIGAFANAGTGSNAGHVRVFRDPSISPGGGSGAVEPLPAMPSGQLIGLAVLLFGVLTMIGQRILSNPNEGLTK